jgi:alkylation response protein AidB-like acyl-CoA dehydrogenase
MNYFFSEDQLEMQELARRIANEKMKPLSEHYDQEGIFPWDIVEVMRQSDLFAILIPEEYDGISGKVMDLAIVTEELCAVDAGIALAFGATGLGMYPILIAEMKSRSRNICPSSQPESSFALSHLLSQCRQ